VIGWLSPVLSCDWQVDAEALEALVLLNSKVWCEL
jgi:hypothetical protein